MKNFIGRKCNLDYRRWSRRNCLRRWIMLFSMNYKRTLFLICIHFQIEGVQNQNLIYIWNWNNSFGIHYEFTYDYICNLHYDYPYKIYIHNVNYICKFICNLHMITLIKFTYHYPFQILFRNNSFGILLLN